MPVSAGLGAAYASDVLLSVLAKGILHRFVR